MINHTQLPKKRSIGIACCRYNPKSKRPEILLVQKRYSYNFQSFVFGYYKIKDNRYLKKLFDGMTKEEKLDILSGKYQLLWFKIFLRYPKVDKQFFTENDLVDIDKVKNHRKTYKKKFHIKKDRDMIKEWKNRYKKKADSFDIPCYTDHDQEDSYYYHQKYKYDRLFEKDGKTRLLSLINQSTNISLLWEIPKGRKNNGEPEISCGIREFYEETGIPPEAYKIITNKPISGNHISENICYIYKYYIAAYDCNYPIDSINYNIMKHTEIINTRWVSLEMHKIMEGCQGRAYRLCKRILKIYKKKHKSKHTIQNRQLS